MTAHVRIAVLIAALKAGEPLAEADALWLGTALESERPMRALGLTVAPGHRSPATIAGYARRDQLFLEAAEKHFPGLSTRKQADNVSKGFAEYTASAWRHEKYLTECPARHRGRVTSYYWEILKVREPRGQSR